ncbi:hypothetical protein [Cyclobacterium jeungdonense]|uniref:DUF1574 domain-containing protein n=1 Tax=Cyclobacterium jeungdonense TaxID=708087 RepID=A0ABT8C7S3_9BACT|nr:hypothetical protein [Cyclobacterium jeungdonense]MDN3687706.1 hypothetical protein [Cyclobacterium jeungdonense]
MKKFILQILFFSIPFAAYCLLIVVIDPYNYLDREGAFSTRTKKQVVSDIEPHLFKMLAFENDPKPNWIIGDSRSNGLYYVTEEKRWANLAYGGASLKEMIQSFWWANSIQQPDTVLMGINLSLYNKYNKRFWVEETISRKSNFFSYSFNNYTFNGAIALLSHDNDQKTVLSEEDNPDAKDYYWQKKLEGVGKFHSNMAYPTEYYQQLEEITDFCRKRGIKLIFWIPPLHIDYQRLVEEYPVEKLNKRFLADLRSLGDVFDFNYASPLTRDKDNFRDPVHFTEEVAKIIFREIRSYSPKNAVIYKFSSTDRNLL